MSEGQGSLCKMSRPGQVGISALGPPEVPHCDNITVAGHDDHDIEVARVRIMSASSDAGFVMQRISDLSCFALRRLRHQGVHRSLRKLLLLKSRLVL